MSESTSEFSEPIDRAASLMRREGCANVTTGGAERLLAGPMISTEAIRLGRAVLAAEPALLVEVEWVLGDDLQPVNAYVHVAVRR